MHKDHRDKLKSVKSKICRDASLPFSPRSGGGTGGGFVLVVGKGEERLIEGAEPGEGGGEESGRPQLHVPKGGIVFTIATPLQEIYSNGDKQLADRDMHLRDNCDSRSRSDDVGGDGTGLVVGVSTRKAPAHSSPSPPFLADAPTNSSTHHTHTPTHTHTRRGGPVHAPTHTHTHTHTHTPVAAVPWSAGGGPGVGEVGGGGKSLQEMIKKGRAQRRQSGFQVIHIPFFIVCVCVCVCVCVRARAVI
jgi:hypothetical protein